jgi:hypothetical protein
MNFKQLDNEHVAQAWERMKSLVKNCPTHGLTTWMIITNALTKAREEKLNRGASILGS